MCESFPESQDFGPIILWLGSESVRLRADFRKPSVKIQPRIDENLELMLLSGRKHYNKLNATLELMLHGF
jgi:hypothetical protein